MSKIIVRVFLTVPDTKFPTVKMIELSSGIASEVNFNREIAPIQITIESNPYRTLLKKLKPEISKYSVYGVNFFIKTPADASYAYFTSCTIITIKIIAKLIY